MNRATKIFLIIAAILFVLGLVLASCGFIMGGREVFGELNRYTIHSPNLRFYSTQQTLDESYNSIHSLDIELNACQLNIIEGDNLHVTVSGHGPKVVSEAQNGTLKIYSEAKKIPMGNVDLVVDITVPKNFNFKSIDIELGVGELYAALLKADNIDIESGASDIIIKSLESSYAQLSCGAGSISISDAHLGETVLECGVGEIYLEVADKEENFGYDCNVGVGEISIGHTKLEGLGNSGSKPSPGKKYLDVSCSAGEIKIDFTK